MGFLALSPDTILGSYTILSLLGKGGMGEVWRARDTKLDRDVAIKVLPEALACDKERVLRFEREAKLLASLNHTNIGQIYGFEEADSKNPEIAFSAESSSWSAISCASPGRFVMRSMKLVYWSSKEIASASARWRPAGRIASASFPGSDKLRTAEHSPDSRDESI